MAVAINLIATYRHRTDAEHCIPNPGRLRQKVLTVSSRPDYVAMAWHLYVAMILPPESPHPVGVISIDKRRLQITLTAFDSLE
jgi:hypothetical protein